MCIKKGCVLLAGAALLFVSCGKEGSTSSSVYNYTFGDPKPIFRLNVSADSSSTNLSVGFSFSDPSVMPTFIINGTHAQSYEFEGDDDWPNAHFQIPYSSSISFTVEAGGRQTTGSFAMPTTPESLSCNGVLLTSQYWLGPDSIPTDSSYRLQWQGQTCDFYEVNLNIDSRDYCYIAQSDTFTIPIPVPSLNRISVTAANGISKNVLLPGDTPNVIGDYGDGYVTLRAYARSYVVVLK